MRFLESFKIAGRAIGPSERPFIIAEISGNHNQSIEKALELIRVAKNVGADAVKLQTYTPDTMTLNLSEREFFVSDKSNLWQGQSLYDLYKLAYTPWDWHKRIFDYCHQIGIICFSTPFDDTAVDFLETLDVPCYKIASFENTDIPLLKKVAKTKKPIIMSTGMASFKELATSLDVLESEGCRDVVLLKCTSAYPSIEADAHMNTIPHMKNAFGINVGLSDHTLGLTVPIVAVTLGAVVIEKHLTLSRTDGGVDSAFSLLPDEFRALVEHAVKTRDALGRITYGPTEREKRSILYRRSIYSAKDIAEGEILTKENIRVVRPSLGLAPEFYDIVLGRKARSAIKMGTAITWEMI